MPRSQHTTPRWIVRWSSSSNSSCASSRRMTLFWFWVLLTLQRSAIVVDFPVRIALIWIRNYPNWHASSSTRSPCGPSCHNTNIACRSFLAGFRGRFHSPYSRRIQSCYQQDLCRLPPLCANPTRLPCLRGGSTSMYNIWMSD